MAMLNLRNADMIQTQVKLLMKILLNWFLVKNRRLFTPLYVLLSLRINFYFYYDL